MFLFGVKKLFTYAVMPHFRDRIGALFFGGFHIIAFYMAQIYASVGLLPQHHPYLNYKNASQYGIRHVIAQAANNLDFRKEKIDQIILFSIMLCGVVLLLIQVILLMFGLIVQPVYAQMPTSFSGFFTTANPTNDVAFIMMDMVFGVSDGTNHFFNSCVAQQINCTESLPAPQTGTREIMVDTDGNSIVAPYGFPFPIHHGLHAMFAMYNTGLLVVGGFITTYFIIAVIAETAQTGTPFGKRFNKVWAPLRIVVAFGLLVPLGLGINGSQYLVLYAAKFGSSFATNGWMVFNSQLSSSYFGDHKKMVSAPNIPEIGALAQFFYTARTCAEMEKLANDTDIKMYLVKGVATSGDTHLEVTTATDYNSMIGFIEENGLARIRFGEQNATAFSDFLGTVNPICGEVVIKLTDIRNPAASNVAEQPEEGTRIMQAYYWQILKEFWFRIYNSGSVFFSENYPLNTIQRYTQWETDENALLPDSDTRATVINFYRNDLKAAMFNPSATGLSGVLNSSIGAIPAMEASDRYTVNNLVYEKGWAATAVWYNRIAEMNGALTTSVLNIPYPTLYPEIMEYVQRVKNMRENTVDFDTRFQPQLSNGDAIPFNNADYNLDKAGALWVAYNFWQADSGGTTVYNTPTNNAIIDSINAMFGTEGLFNIRRNPDTHPTGQLVGVGRSLIEASIRNLTLAIAGGTAGKLLGFLDADAQKPFSISTTFLVTITMVGLTAGFVLFYVVPFLPFIYFFFALGGWIKGIFEAMVGAPLWALAHIRIDQNGLPGPSGVAGYFLIFEIFIRPILMVFGMLASISIFSALVTVLHQIFDLVIANVGGFDVRAEFEGMADDGTTVILPTLENARSAVDQFFFTILYVIIVYLMAMSSFKMIDLVPNNILRWLGQSITTFNDEREDAAQQLAGKATVGSQQTSSALGGGLKSLTS